jgi:cytochrome oxidase assembly protein ShyY1
MAGLTTYLPTDAFHRFVADNGAGDGEDAGDPASDCWYSHDVPAIAARRGLSRAAPFFVDIDDAPDWGAWRKARLTLVSFPNSHLVYALIWFNLAPAAGRRSVQRLLRHKH